MPQRRAANEKATAKKGDAHLERGQTRNAPVHDFSSRRIDPQKQRGRRDDGPGRGLVVFIGMEWTWSLTTRTGRGHNQPDRRFESSDAHDLMTPRKKCYCPGEKSETTRTSTTVAAARPAASDSKGSAAALGTTASTTPSGLTRTTADAAVAPTTRARPSTWP